MPKPTTYQNLFFIIIILLLPFSCADYFINKNSNNINQKEIIFENSDSAVFAIEMADTEEKRRIGLMNRKELPDNYGMLFVFPNVDNHMFWMQNTFIPLDIIFFNDNFSIVGIIENTIPHSLKLLGINKPSRYALEVKAGMVKKYGLAVGMRALSPF